MITQLSFWRRLFGSGDPDTDASSQRRRPDPRTAALAAGSPGSHRAAASADSAAGNLKALRANRREQLFAIVRENMVRAGVLPSAYKFKILTLDRQAQDFIVLCDIQPSAFDGHPDVLARLESSLKQLARERMNVGVRSVYWRHAQVIVSSRDGASTSGAAAQNRASQGSSAMGAAGSAGATVHPAHSAQGTAQRPSLAQPQVVVPPMTEDTVTEEEVLALKQALAAAQASGVAVTRRSPAPSASPAPAQAKASVSASSVPEWKRRDFAPTQPMADDEEDSLYMPLSETQLGRLD